MNLFIELKYQDWDKAERELDKLAKSKKLRIPDKRTMGVWYHPASFVFHKGYDN